MLLSQSSKRSLWPISASAASCLRLIDSELLWMLTLGRLPFWEDYRRDQLARIMAEVRFCCRGNPSFTWLGWSIGFGISVRVCYGLDVAQLEKRSLEVGQTWEGLWDWFSTDRPR